MGNAGGGSIKDGLNVLANHDAIVKNFERLIPRARELQVPNVITFFGNRKGMSDEEADGQLHHRPEPRQGHRRSQQRHDLRGAPQQQDRSQGLPGGPHALRRRIVKAVGSPRVKLLYDIYHMQIMEGDLIRTIRDNFQYHRPLPHRWRAGPARARRHAGSHLARGGNRDRATSSTTGISRTSSCRRAIPSRRSGKPSRSATSSIIRGALPLGLPDTRARAPLRRRAPLAWLARGARSPVMR